MDSTTTTTAAQIVNAALARSSAGYIENTLATRNPGPASEGSTFLEPQTAESLAGTDWQSANDPAICAPAVGFTAPIAGLLGIVELSKLDPTTPCRMVLCHKGDLPFVSAVVARTSLPENLQKVDFTTMLLGPDRDSGELIVWTFFPGSAIPPSTMTPDTRTEAVQTVADAIALGFGYGKVVAKID